MTRPAEDGVGVTHDPRHITPLRPFLKWAGGKRWFVQHHSHILPTNYNRYIEPFLGGGSVFFYLQPERAVLGDLNPDVIAAYLGIKRDWKSIAKSLAYRQRAHSHDEQYYYRLRQRVPTTLVQRASRSIYLNRTCFNGIYRVNLKGEFNVPRGTKDNVVMDSDNFQRLSRLLRRVDIRLADFEELVDEAQSDDLIFADPPYTVRHNLNGFVKYNEILFSWKDQERLARALVRAKARGAYVVCTNANHASIRALYQRAGFHLQAVSRFSSISGNANSRKQFEEVIIVSHSSASPNKRLSK